MKSAFMDEELNKHMKLTSANSIKDVYKRQPVRRSTPIKSKLSMSFPLDLHVLSL